ncbi:hypothetical protein E4T48_06978 [Aureobasidium sp. EXF-10727]|nr:hypothetical protein E4T48_06978 [Aureobasidium sp. EXF-10727]
MNGFDDIDMPDAGDESDNDSTRSSVVSVTTPPTDTSRTYTAMDPPRLPPWTNIKGTPHETNWKQHSWRYTARKDAIGTGFEVRPLGIDEFDGYEVPDWNNMFYWPAKYALGPPTQEPKWHALLDKWGFPVLEKAGFLRYDAPEEDEYMAPIGRLAKARNPSGDDDKLIHPVLRREMWKDINDEEYGLLEPALLLASALLDDPATLTFLYAVADVKAMTEFQDTVHGVGKVVSMPTTLTNAQQTAVFEKILAMRSWMTWNFAPQRDMLADNAYGLTDWRKDANDEKMRASSQDCYQSEVFLCQTFLDVLQRYEDDFSNGTSTHKESLEAWLDRANVPASRRPKVIDATSAYDRTNFFLADTIVHEFAHAFNGAYFPLPDTTAPSEPWIQGNRSNEMGSAFMSYLLGGEPYSMPYYSKDEGERTTTADRDQALATEQVFYPVPQKWVWNMGTQETWLHQVPRFGMAVLRLPRLEDWAIGQKKPS